MGILSGIAFMGALANEQEEKTIIERLDAIEKRIERLEKATMPCVHCKNLTAEAKYFAEEGGDGSHIDFSLEVDEKYMGD